MTQFELEHHDVIIHEEDCGTLRGLVCTEIKNNEEVVASLGERILGRVSVHDVVNPLTNEILVHAGEEITEVIAKKMEDSPIEQVGDSFGSDVRIEERCLC